MTRLRQEKLSTAALIASIIATIGGGAFAQAVHTFCVARQHECGTTARLTACCCGDQGGAPIQGAPVPSRANPGSTLLLSTPAVSSGVQVATTPRALITVHTSPPRRCFLDLPTLFASLLL